MEKMIFIHFPLVIQPLRLQPQVSFIRNLKGLRLFWLIAVMLLLQQRVLLGL